MDGVLTPEHLFDKKKSVKILADKYYGYFLHKNKETYFLCSEGVEDLPIKVTKSKEYDFKGEVFSMVLDYKSVKIPNVKKMEFRDLIDNLSNFEHTNPLHFKLYKIITVTAFCNRINYRVIAPAGFGKDCTINNLIDLGSTIVNIYGATFAKLEYNLKHPFLFFNEMGNLKADDKTNMQQFLLATGAYFNSYSKKSRKGEDTLEVYDISKTSLGIAYNPPNYYIERGQEFFDKMFQPAVLNRFIPFSFSGVIRVPTTIEDNTYEEAKKNLPFYKDFVSTINYYKDNEISNKYGLDDSVVFNKYEDRYKRTFETLCKYISEYSKDEKEYYELVFELYNCFIRYKNEIRKTMGDIVIEEV